MVFDQDIEQHILGGMLNKPDMFRESDITLHESDFYFDANKTIFAIASRAILHGEEIDRIGVLNRIRDLQLHVRDDVNMGAYLTGIYAHKPGAKTFRQRIKELKKLSFRRAITEAAENIRIKASKSGTATVEELQRFIDTEMQRPASALFCEDASFNLFDNLYDLIEERGENPIEEIGVPTPFPEFNKTFGGCKYGSIYTWAARPGSGKSTLLNGMAMDMANSLDLLLPERLQAEQEELRSKGLSNEEIAKALSSKYNIPALVIDTEMGEEDAVEVKFRLAAKISGINPWYFSTGNWRKNQEYIDIVRNPNFRRKLNEYRLDYKYVPDSSTANLLSVIRQWYYSKVGRGNPCIVVYDYIKMSESDEGTKGQDAEHQVIGAKLNALKGLFTKEIRGVLLTAVQLNRGGEARNKGRSDDSSALAQSDRIQWFSTYTGIFRKKSTEEISEHGREYGTHTMIHLKGRFNGREGFNEIIENHKGEKVYNSTMFSVKNFNVSEVISAAGMYLKLDKKPKPVEKTAEKKEVDAPF